MTSYQVTLLITVHDYLEDDRYVRDYIVDAEDEEDAEQKAIEIDSKKHVSNYPSETCVLDTVRVGA